MASLDSLLPLVDVPINYEAHVLAQLAPGSGQAGYLSVASTPIAMTISRTREDRSLVLQFQYLDAEQTQRTYSPSYAVAVDIGKNSGKLVRVTIPAGRSVNLADVLSDAAPSDNSTESELFVYRQTTILALSLLKDAKCDLSTLDAG